MLTQSTEQWKIVRYEEVIENLFKIIDSIDTASDIFKEDLASYQEYVVKRAQDRFLDIDTDGLNMSILDVHKTTKKGAE